MILFHSVVLILVVSVPNFASDDPAIRLRIRRVLVRGKANRSMICDSQKSSKESTSSMLISLLAEHRIQKVAVSINCTIQVAPSSADLHIRLVQIPGMIRASSASLSKILGY